MGSLPESSSIDGGPIGRVITVGTDGSEGTKLSEGLAPDTDNVLTSPKGTNFVNLTASGLVLSGRGKLVGIFVNSGTPTIKFWDSLTATGTVINNTFQTTAATMYRFPEPRVINGIYCTITGTADVTVYFDPTTA